MRGYIAFACCRYLCSYAILLSLLPNTARMASVLMSYNFGREVTLQKSLRTGGAEVNVASIELINAPHYSSSCDNNLPL